LQGKAGAELLSTYDGERCPVGAFTVEQAYSRYVTRWARHLAGPDMQPIVNDLDVDLGYRYRSHAVIPDGADDGRLVEPTRETRGRPGTRAPHLLLHSRGGISMLDLLGSHFALLAGPEGDTWSVAAREAAHETGMELDVYGISEPGFPQAYGITSSGAVLVRPDGVVGWRAQTAAGASASALRQVLESLLMRGGIARSHTT
jgi:putative polyketide hydroxylase